MKAIDMQKQITVEELMEQGPSPDAKASIARPGSIGNNMINLDKDLEANVGRFITASGKVVQAIASNTSELDDEIEQMRAEEAEIELRRRESEFYRLIRKAFVAQANGDFELGTRLQEVMAETEEPLTEAEFDDRMQLAVTALTLQEGT